jgi:hypothetical protein
MHHWPGVTGSVIDGSMTLHWWIYLVRAAKEIVRLREESLRVR